MNRISLRIYFLLVTAFTWLRSFAQDDDDDDDFFGSHRMDPDDFPMDEMMNYRPFHIRFSDIVTWVLIILACYVFGKIWKGCTYMIILLVIFYYFVIK